MTEQHKPDVSEREQLKKEIIRDIRRGDRRRKLLSCLGCLVVEIAIILIPVIWVASFLARSGLVEVPMMSSRMYRPAEPSRVVAPLAGSTVEGMMSAAAARAKYNASTGVVTLELKEAELTTLVNNALAGAKGQLPFPVKSAQIAVLPEGLELFVVTPREGRDIGIRLLLDIEAIEQGKLKVTIKEAQVGGQSLPDFINSTVSSALGPTLGDALVSGLAGAGTVASVELRDAALVIGFIPKR